MPMLNLIEKNYNGKLSPRLTAKEVKCRCKNPECQYFLIDERLLHAFERLRLMVGGPLIINSGYRCIMHNAKIGGKLQSRHTMGMALDIQLPTHISQKEFIKMASLAGFAVVIIYGKEGFAHCHINPEVV